MKKIISALAAVALSLSSFSGSGAVAAGLSQIDLMPSAGLANQYTALSGGKFSLKSDISASLGSISNLKFEIVNVTGAPLTTTLGIIGSSSDTDVTNWSTQTRTVIASTAGSVSGTQATLQLFSSNANAYAKYEVRAWYDSDGDNQVQVFEQTSGFRTVEFFQWYKSGMTFGINEPTDSATSLIASVNWTNSNVNLAQIASRLQVDFEVFNSVTTTWDATGSTGSFTVSTDGTALVSEMSHTQTLGERYRMKLSHLDNLFSVLASDDKTTVAQGATVGGTLKNMDGTVISGASISIYSTNQKLKFTKWATTSGSGSFSLTNVPRGEFTLTAYKWTGTGYFYVSKSVEVLSLTSHTHNLKMPNFELYKLSGKVVSSTEFVGEVKKPLDGITVNAWAYGIEDDTYGTWSFHGSVQSDENGNYTFPGLPAQTLQIGATTQNELVRYKALYGLELLKTSADQVFDIELEPFPTGTSTLRGVVTDHTSQPISGMDVNLYCSLNDQDFNYQQKTDSAGSYAFTNMPDYAACSIGAYNENFLYYNSGNNNLKIKLTAGATTSHNIRVIPNGTSTITGRVISTSGVAISGVKVSLRTPDNSRSSYWSGSAITDASGDYTIAEVPISLAGAHQLQVETNYSEWDSENDTQIQTALGYFSPEISTVEVLAQGSNLTRNFTLQAVPAGTKTLSGKVINKVTGLPVQGASVALGFYYAESNRATSIIKTAVTDVDGNYQFANINHSTYYSLEVSAAGFVKDSWGYYLTTSELTKVRNLVINPSTPGSNLNSLVGTITDGTNPVVYANIDLQSNNYTVYRYASSSQSGGYSFTGLPNGTYTMTINKWGTLSGRQTNLYDEERIEFTLNGNGTVTRNVALTRAPSGTAVLTGRVVDDRLNTGVAGVSIWLFKSGSNSSSWSITTDQNGNWRATNVPAGTYSLNVNTYETGGSYRYINTRQIEVVDAVTNVVPAFHTSSASPGSASASITIRDRETKSPLVGREISIWSIDYDSLHFSGTTDEKGVVKFENVPQADYSVNFWSSDYAIDSNSTWFSVGNENVKQTFWADSIVSQGSISGRVLDESGDPIENIDVSASYGISYGCCSGDGVSATSTTNSLGEYKIEGLALNKALSVQTNADIRDMGGWAVFQSRITLSKNAKHRSGYDIVLKPAAFVSGSIVLTGGAATPNSLQVLAIDAGTKEVLATVWTDSLLNFSFSTLQGGNLVFAIADRSWPESPKRLAYGYIKQTSANAYVITGNIANATTFVIAANSSRHLGNIQAKAGAKVSGSISTEARGQIANTLSRMVQIKLHQKSGSSWLDLGDYASAWASSTGTYEIVGVPDGVYKAEFIDPYYGDKYFDPTFYGQKFSLVSATEFTVLNGLAVENVNATISIKAPSTSPTKKDLGEFSSSEKASLKDQVGASKSGNTITVAVGKEYAGEWVSIGVETNVVSRAGLRASNVVAPSNSATSNWVQVDADGNVSVSSESAVANGQVLVVQDADNQVIGWTGLAVSSNGSSGVSSGLESNSQVKPPVVSPSKSTAPRLLVSPSLKGTLTVGKTLVAKPGTWIASKALKFKFSWMICSKPVAAAAKGTTPSGCSVKSSASSFKLTTAARGKYIALRVAATSSGKTSYSIGKAVSRVK
jgi:5-hydroxyisourate hydrolase-like protein (transthyretin family)